MDNGASSYHRFLNGDTDALEELVRLYSDDLVRYAYCYVRNSEIAEDVMEDTFAALIVKKKRFGENSSFKAYLFRIARNKCLDYLRKRRTVPMQDVENVLKSEDTEREIFARERGSQIYAALQKLPPQYSEVLYLSYFDGFSADEIKSYVGKNRKQIYNLLARAKTALKEILIKDGICYEDL